LSYRVLLESGAERDLQAIPEPLRAAIIQRILTLRDNPHPSGCKKLSGTARNWRRPPRRLPHPLRRRETTQGSFDFPDQAPPRSLSVNGRQGRKHD
jgi:hypothetical protein